MTSNADLLLSRVVIIKQFYFYAGFVGDESFNRICEKLEKSNRFRDFKSAYKDVFSLHFRGEGESFKTFELKEGVEIFNLELINTTLSGHLRILITVYRAGFAVISMIHSIIPKGGVEEEGQRNLISTSPLAPIDVCYLLEEAAIPTYPVTLKYEVESQKTTVEMGSSDIVEYLIEKFEDYGVSIQRKPRKICRIVYCWDFSPNSKTALELVEENYKDLFIMFTTPKTSILQRKSKQSLIGSLKSCLYSPSESQCIFFDSQTMLIMSPRKRTSPKIKPNDILRSSVLQVFQLCLVEDFLLDFYSMKVRRIASELVSATPDEYPNLLDLTIKLREGFSLALEDLYWVEDDLKRVQSATFVADYKRKFRLNETLDTIQKRFSWIHERCVEALTVLEHRFLKKREESISNLTLIFATFGLGDILSTFLVWYFGYLVTKEPAPTSYLILGLLATLSVISVIFLVSRWYVKKTTKQW